VIAAVAIASIATLAAAGSSGAAHAKALTGKSVYLVTCEPNVWCHAANAEFVAKMKAAGVAVTQLSDNFDPALQDQHMSQAIAAKPSAIVIFASNADAIVPALKRAHDAGIPLVNVNALLKPAGAKYLETSIVADNAALGQAAAANLVSGMTKAGYTKGNVVLVTGTLGTRIVQDRIDAFNAYMKKYPQFKVVATEDGNWDQVKSSQVALQLFTKYRALGGIQGAYGMADYQAAGIIQAATQLGIKTGWKSGDTVVTGSNCTPAGIPLMQQGKLWGDATQSPIGEADTWASTTLDVLNGKSVPKVVTVKEVGFTADDVKGFVNLCAKWPK